MRVKQKCPTLPYFPAEGWSHKAVADSLSVGPVALSVFDPDLKLFLSRTNQGEGIGAPPTPLVSRFFEFALGIVQLRDATFHGCGFILGAGLHLRGVRGLRLSNRLESLVNEVDGLHPVPAPLVTGLFQSALSADHGCDSGPEFCRHIGLHSGGFRGRRLLWGCGHSWICRLCLRRCA